MKNAEAVSTVLDSVTELAAPGSTIPSDSPSNPTPDFNIGYPEEQQMKELVRRVVWCLNSGLATAEVLRKCTAWNLHNTPGIPAVDVWRCCFRVEHNNIQRFANTQSDADIAVETLNKSYAWIKSNSEIFRFAHNDFIKPDKFRLEHSNKTVEAEVAGKMKKIPVSEAWHRSQIRRCHKGIVYAPGEPQIFNDNVNLWQGWGCVPKAGDIGPWNALLDYVFANEAGHRSWFERWVAYPIQWPGEKLNSAVVLWSNRQGVGKTLIGQTIGKIYGDKNYKEITANVLRSSFNGWTKTCQFILGEENSSSKRLTDSDRLKHLITGETIEVNEKFQPLVKLNNCINFMFTSNHANAFYLESSDRRYFVWEIQGQPLPLPFYTAFVDWRDNQDGLAALMDHLRNLKLGEFEPKGHAPMTPAKEAMIETGRTELEQWLTELRDDPAHALATVGSEIIQLEKLAEIYNRDRKGRVTPEEVGRALQRLGPCKKVRIQVRPGTRLSFHAISRVEHWAAMDRSVWHDEAQKTLSPSVGMGMSSS